MKDLTYYELEGDKYFLKFQKSREPSEIISNLENSLRNYREARKLSEGLVQQRIIGKINNVNEGLRNFRALGNDSSKGLSKKFYVFLSILSFVFALSSVTFNMTGNVVGESLYNDVNYLGLCFFLCGLTFTFFYFRKK